MCISGASSVLAKRVHNVAGFELTAIKPNAEPIITKGEIAGSLEVHGIPENISEIELRIAFENVQLTGGGPITAMELDRQKAVACVTFQDNKGNYNCIQCSGTI